jgi:hypothetical protein
MNGASVAPFVFEESVMTFSSRMPAAIVLSMFALGVHAQTTPRDAPEQVIPNRDAPAGGAIILAPGVDNGARERGQTVKPSSRDGVLEPNASSGATSSGAPATDPQTENRRGSIQSRDAKNRRDDTGRRDNQDR